MLSFLLFLFCSLYSSSLCSPLSFFCFFRLCWSGAFAAAFVFLFCLLTLSLLFHHLLIFFSSPFVSPVLHLSPPSFSLSPLCLCFHLCASSSASPQSSLHFFLFHILFHFPASHPLYMAMDLFAIVVPFGYCWHPGPVMSLFLSRVPSLPLRYLSFLLCVFPLVCLLHIALLVSLMRDCSSSLLTIKHCSLPNTWVSGLLECADSQMHCCFRWLLWYCVLFFSCFFLFPFSQHPSPV